MIKNQFITRLALITALILTLAVTQGFAEEKSTTSALTGMAQQAEALSAGGSLGELININSATPEMLASIPGVGPKLGEAITAYRNTNGSFKEIKDLLNVEGIDMALLEKIKPFLKL